MEFFDSIIQRNSHFAERDFKPELKMMPSTSTIIVGCVDPRVDPASVLGLEQGEAVVIRNVGGRVSKQLFETLAVLRVVAKVAGMEGGARNLILLHHTDCGIIGCYRRAPDLLARYLAVELAALDNLAIADPRKAVAHDVAALKANDQLPGEVVVSGLVYDVKTGRVETVVPPTALRPPAD